MFGELLVHEAKIPRYFWEGKDRGIILGGLFLWDGGSGGSVYQRLTKTLSPNFLMISDFVVVSRLSQPQNALSPIDVTLGGMVIEVRFSHPENAPSPIAVTLGGMVIEVRLEK